MGEDYPPQRYLLAMDQKLIDIGIGVFHGSGQEESQEKAVQELVTRALESIDSAKLPVRFAMLLATADWCRSEVPLPKLVRSALRERLHHDVPLIGGSSSQLYVSTEPEPLRFIEHGIALLIFCSEDIWLSVTCLDRPYDASSEERRHEVYRILHQLQIDAGVRLGASANRFLFGFLPGVVTDKDGKRAYYDHELHQDILTSFNHRLLFFGASTTDQIEPSAGYQFANDECLKSGMAVALLETDLCVGAAMSHGFGKSGAPRVSVSGLADADQNGSGYGLTLLDEKPAAQRIQDLKNDGWVRFDRPVFGTPHGSDFDIYWPLELLAANDATIRLKRKVTLGDSLYLLDAEPEKMLKTAEQTVQNAFDKSTAAKSDDVSLLLCFLCGGRSRQFEMRQVKWKETVEQVRRAYPSIPIVGAMVAGEFGVDGEHEARANNMGVSVICLANAYHRRARIRTLQRNLVRAASNLLTCKTPKEVRENALQGAIAAGATGGKINIVDRDLGRILGMEFGHALNAPNSYQDWEAVAKHTDYEMPAEGNGDFPIELRDKAMAVVPDLPFRINFVNSPTQSADGKWDNILQLVVRTRHAVFIPNWLEFERSGLCNAKARAEGNLISELVIPLVGSQFGVIATLQLSFPDDMPLDRESLALWIGYGQSVAAALEQTEEAELNRALEEISKIGNKIMRTPLLDYQTPDEWCERYLAKVVDQLGADGGAMRTLEYKTSVESDKKYRLSASVGILGDILLKSRPVVPEDDEGFFRDKLGAGDEPIFLNRGLEVAERFEVVKPVRNKKVYVETLAKKLKQVKATCFVPLSYQEELLGTFHIYSKQEYFFTGRRKKIARAAAELGGWILQAKIAEYGREYLNRQMTHLEGLLALKTEGTAGERLQQMLEHVCVSIGADIGSIFAWHDIPERLVLHTYYNWHKPLVGEAEYRKGEGWTGGLVQEEEDIVLVNSFNDTESDKRKYYKEMIAPEHRSQRREFRIGIRLTAGKHLLGVMTLVYYREHASKLNDQFFTIRAFLRKAREYITLGLQLAQQEAREKRTKDFFATEARVSNILINNAYSRASWQWALNAIREYFEVECLTFYEMQDDKLVKGVRSTDGNDGLRPDELSAPVEPDSPLKKVILDQEPVWMSDSNDLKRWPGGQSIKGLIAFPVVTADGETRGVLELVNRLKTPSHPFESFDIMERNMAEDVARNLGYAIGNQENESLRTQLATATKIGAQMLSSAIVMHQITTPFANMRGVIDWLLLHPDNPPEERAQYLKHIEKFYTQALETIRQAGRHGAPGRRREKLRALVQQAIRFIEPDIPATGIKVEVTNELPVEVNVDPMSVVGALVNLLSNALEAINGSGTMAVSTEISSDGQAAVIHIYNTSSPITAADIARFFQPGISTKGAGDHLGLGIPLAKQAIEAAGGTLRLFPTAEGVEAVVSLPLADGRQEKTDGAKGVSS